MNWWDLATMVSLAGKQRAQPIRQKEEQSNHKQQRHSASFLQMESYARGPYFEALGPFILILGYERHLLGE